jgi:3-dehydroquinate synthase
MVDSSVGGKTGVNSAAGKNLIGAFHQPSLVVIDPDLLRTMAPREYRAGLAEVVKYGVIYDAEFFAWQEQHASALREVESAAIMEAVYRSCAIKGHFVVNDEHENGLRAKLNYGHTFGHALEGETAYERYLHGEAVAIGMRMAAVAAQELRMLEDDQLIARQDALLAALELPLSHTPVDDGELDRLIARCAGDKKVSAGTQRFILPRCMGVVDIISNPDPAAIRNGFLAGCVQAVAE